MPRRYTFLTAVLLLLVTALATTASATPQTFTAHLTGAEEVADEPVVTTARGQAIFQLSADGSELSFRLIVANIQNLRMAHIHQGPRGVNGPITVWLYPEGPPFQQIDGRFQGVLSTGVITADHLVGPLEGQPLSALIDDIVSGNAYVNVHTAQFPAGEVRGQL